MIALKTSQRQVSTTTERNELLLPNIGSIGVSTVASQVRPSREFKRTQKLLNSFSSANANTNTNSNGKSVPTSKEKPKLKTAFRPASDYDYYDDGDSVLGRTTSKVMDNFIELYTFSTISPRILHSLPFRLFKQVKVIIHEAGAIECLDQGNFPHPLSCRKFISCAKMEIKGVIGWEYTCPKGLR